MNDKLRSFLENPAYERRAVAFYDILGWRSQIKLAGNDVEKIGKLRRMILRASRMLAIQQANVPNDIRFSSFSDNIVISVEPTKEAIFHLLLTLGSFQLGSTGGGFLVRGGLTIGDLIHDKDCVFGPALNRAYELESKIANVPRIVIDQNVLDVLGSDPFFMDRDNDIVFYDPFTFQFVSYLQSLDRSKTEEFWKQAGIPVPGSLEALSTYRTSTLLKSVMHGIKGHLKLPLDDKEWDKFSWLYDRIAGELGVPHASSYPRVRPEDVVK